MIKIKPWLLKKGNWLLLLSGLFLGLSVPGIGLWTLAWVALVPALWVLMDCKSLKEAWLQGLAVGCIYHAILFSWFLGLHPLTWIGFSTQVSLVVTFIGWGAAFMTQGFVFSVIWLIAYALRRFGQTALILGLPIVWVVGFWFLNRNPIGLPFGFLAYSQAAVPWIRESTYTVTFWGLEFLMVLSNIALFQGLYQRRWQKLLPAAFSILAILLSVQLHLPYDKGVLQKLYPVVIQGDIPIETERLFLGPADKQAYYQSLIDQAVRQYGAQTRLIVLPEGVIGIADPKAPNPFTVPGNTALLSGAIFRSDAGVHNGAALFIDRQAPQLFAKRYLVPFGETTPFVSEDWLVPTLKHFGVAYEKGFSPAPPDQALFQFGTVRLGPLICFEALYPNLVMDYHRHNADLLVTFSNLGWYHQHPLLQEQFLAANQMRAAESGTPLILATNTGISALINAQGKILSQSTPGKVQVLTIP
jgi:apolipoprotein N-acyltransferase